MGLLASTLAGAAQVYAQAFQEHVQYEYEQEPVIFYVECIGDQNLTTTLTAAVVRQTTVSPSGQLHFHDHWRLSGYAVSDNGEEWYSHGSWPARENLDINGSKVVLKNRLTLISRPMGDNPYPKLKAGLSVHFLQNTNGDLLINRFELSTPDCFASR